MSYQPSPRPTSSPWGGPQHAAELAPGIWAISTASHGGLHLSEERNALVPAEIRPASGWFEEDDMWAVVALVHPDAFTLEETARARVALLHSHPRTFTLLTGEAVAPGQSPAFDRECFYRDNPDAWVVTSAINDTAAWVPIGMVGVYARQGEPGSRRYHAAERCFVLSEAVYERRLESPVGYVIDLASDQEVPPPANPLARRR